MADESALLDRVAASRQVLAAVASTMDAARVVRERVHGVPTPETVLELARLRTTINLQFLQLKQIHRELNIGTEDMRRQTAAVRRRCFSEGGLLHM
jgi:hypothetical protein